jgi:hypothetical protein
MIAPGWGSDRNLPIAVATWDERWILSARYGLVALDRELPYYCEQLPTRRRERGEWGTAVLASLPNARAYVKAEILGRLRICAGGRSRSARFRPAGSLLALWVTCGATRRSVWLSGCRP